MAATFKPVLDSKPNKEGLYQVRFRITVNRRHAYLATGIRILKSEWNPRGTLARENWIKTACPMAEVYNVKLRRLNAKLNEIALDIEPGADANAIKLKYEQPDSAADFMAYFKKELDHVLKTESYGTWEHYRAVYTQIEEFQKGRPLPIVGVNVTFLKELEKFFSSGGYLIQSKGKTRTAKGNSTNTITAKMSKVRAVINRAIKEGLMDAGQNPFQVHTLKKTPVHKERLNRDIIGELAAMQLKGRKENARDIFLFQFYMQGMRIGNALMLKNMQVVGDRILFQMSKGGKSKAIKLQPQALEIVKKYQSKNPGDFIFPFLENGLNYKDPKIKDTKIGSATATINNNLRYLSKDLGLPNAISTHISRHTFADLARQSGMDLYTISKGLGHSSLKVTEAYLSDFDDEGLNSAMDDFYSKM